MQFHKKFRSFNFCLKHRFFYIYSIYDFKVTLFEFNGSFYKDLTFIYMQGKI